MKTTQLITLTMALGMMGLMSVGCSKSKSQSNDNNAPTQATVPAVIIDPPAPIGATGPNTSLTPTTNGGATAVFIPNSLTVMNKYVATHPLNAPTNFRVNVNLSQVESGRYAGQVTISYIDNGMQFDGIFQSGTGRNLSAARMYDNDALESAYNYWFNLSNRLVFTGQFEDSYGAIVLSLEPEKAASTGGDADPIAASTYKGTVYFKNFTAPRNTDGPWYQSYGGAPQSYERARHCWFVYLGPYDCRSGEIQQKTALAPGAGAGYTALGTFTGLSIKNGFNIQ
ncbi:MAG: hypothetical protein H7061_09680 [Bdellovibrionaceae bacterium]|nr:hypothetical protein [Bdellovibrio sp.]